MHELSIAMNILDLAEEEAQRRGGVQVVGIHLKLGPLSGVVKDALVSAFEIARADSSLADAQLVVEEVPIRAYCPTCRTNRPVVSVQEICCAECGTATPDVVSGREMEIAALEIRPGSNNRSEPEA